jgi:hypothetical protein
VSGSGVALAQALSARRHSANSMLLKAAPFIFPPNELSLHQAMLQHNTLKFRLFDYIGYLGETPDLLPVLSYLIVNPPPCPKCSLGLAY